MRCVSSVVMALALLVIGCGSSPQSGALDGTSSVRATSTTEPADATSSTGSSSGGPPAWGDAGPFCNPGREGCSCGEQDTCEEELVCDGNLCRREVLCGDGRVDLPESCDDGNVTSGDGCSSVCQWERHCVVGLVGDTLGTLRTLSFDSDGTLQLEADRTVAVHQPAPASLGRSVRRCGPRAFVVSHASGLVQSVEGLGASESPGVAVEGALELACAETSQLLFVTAQTDAGFEVQLFDAADGGLVLLDVSSIDTEAIPRMAVDETTERLWLVLPGAPLRLLRLEYADLVLSPEEPLATGLDVTHADDFLWFPSVGAGVIVSGAPDGEVTRVSADLETWPSSTGPWENQQSVEPLVEPFYPEVFVMGGSAGAVRGRIGEFGQLFGVGPGLAADLGDTLVRTAMDGSRILVASSAELRILAPVSAENGALLWEELDRVSLPRAPGFESGAVIPCP